MAKQKKIMMPKGAIQRKAEWSGTRGSYLTRIPDLAKETLEEIEVVAVREPYSYIRVVYDHDRAEYLYEVWEPQLDEREQKLLDMLKDSLSRTLEYEWDKMKEKDKKEYLDEAVESFIKSRGLRLEPASRDKVVSCDGTAIPLFIFHQKYESIKTSVIFADDDILNSFVVMLGQRCGKQISVANPILDGTSVEGHRVQATYSHEVTTRGSSFTIRRYKEKPFTPVELVKFKTASSEMVAYIWIAVENGKAGGEIDMYDLVRAALRQRPNYILVGEVRGKETYTMFQAMATGHPTMSTMHADSVKSMVNRLENPPINTPRILKHARVGDATVRRVTQIVELVGFE